MKRLAILMGLALFAVTCAGATLNDSSGTFTINGSVTITNGGTVGAPLLSTSTTTNGPGTLELATAGWVRSLLSGIGTILYNSGDTNASGFDSPTFAYVSAIPASGNRTYTSGSLSAGSYFGSVMTTNTYLQIGGDVSVQPYMTCNGGAASANYGVHAEIYYTYDKTNLLGDWESGTQLLTHGAHTNKYGFIVPVPQTVSTNSTGFYLVRRMKVDAKTGSDNITLHYGTNTPSSISLPTPASVGANWVASGTTNSTLAGTATALGYTSKDLLDIRSFGAVSGGVTDNSVALTNAIWNAYTNNGGTIYIPIGVWLVTNQITFPNDSTPVTTNNPYSRQPMIRIVGSGGQFNGQRTFPQTAHPGSQLLLTYSGTNGSGAKIQTFGLGVLELNGLTLVDTTGSTNAMFYTTGTTPHIYNCSWFGKETRNGTNNNQDCIILGGTLGNFSGINNPDAAFQGYNALIEECYFNHFRRYIYARAYLAGSVIQCNWFDQGGGSDLVDGAAIEFDGACGQASSNGESFIAFNRFQAGGYPFAIKFKQSIGNMVIGNDYEDNQITNNIGVVLFESDAPGNSVYLPFVQTGGGITSTNHIVDRSGLNTIIDQTQSSLTVLPPEASDTRINNASIQGLLSVTNRAPASIGTNKPAPAMYWGGHYHDGANSTNDWWQFVHGLDNTTNAQSKLGIDHYGVTNDAQFIFGTTVSKVRFGGPTGLAFFQGDAFYGKTLQLSDTATFQKNVSIQAAINGELSETIYNQDGSHAAAAAKLQLSVNGNSAGDPYIEFNVATIGNQWAVGLDNSDGDKFKISYGGSTVGTGDELVLDQTNHLATVANLSVTGTNFVNSLVVTNTIPTLAVGTLTFSGGSANVVPVFDGNTNIVSSATSTNQLNLLSTNANLALVASDAAIRIAAAQTLTNKTFDASGAGNVLKQTKYMLLMRPDYGDGTKAVPQTNAFNASGLMHYTFAGDGETNTCWVVYETAVPPDIDTSVEMTATIAFVSGGTDADTVTFHLTYALGASGTALPTGTGIATSPIVVTTTPTTPASGDVQQSAATTLTGWAASMTAGTPLFIRMARLNDSNDDTQRDLWLRIAYASTQ